MKQEFPLGGIPPETAWFKEFNVHLDLGFKGFEDLYPCQNLFIPIKKPRNTKTSKNELNDEQKTQNKALAQQRIYVEHSIGGMKRYRILVNRNRLKNKKTINQVIGVCAALWNFTIEP